MSRLAVTGDVVHIGEHRSLFTNVNPKKYEFTYLGGMGKDTYVMYTGRSHGKHHETLTEFGLVWVSAPLGLIAHCDEVKPS